MTDAEQKLWSGVRRKQILEVPFYRQKPIGDYIVDFYAPKAKLVIEIDGSQHFTESYLKQDKTRDDCLKQHSLLVLRFDNLQVLQQLEGVMEKIYRTILERLKKSP